MMRTLIIIGFFVLISTLIIPMQAFAVNYDSLSTKIGILPKKTYDQIAEEKLQQKFRFHFTGSYGSGLIFSDGFMSAGKTYKSTVRSDGQYGVNWNSLNQCTNTQVPMRVFDENGNALQLLLDGKVCQTKKTSVKKYTGGFTIVKGENKLKGSTGFGSFVINANTNSHYVSGVMYGKIVMPT